MFSPIFTKNFLKLNIIFPTLQAWDKHSCFYLFPYFCGKERHKLKFSYFVWSFSRKVGIFSSDMTCDRGNFSLSCCQAHSANNCFQHKLLHGTHQCLGLDAEHDTGKISDLFALQWVNCVFVVKESLGCECQSATMTVGRLNTIVSSNRDFWRGNFITSSTSNPLTQKKIDWETLVLGRFYS